MQKPANILEKITRFMIHGSNLGNINEQRLKRLGDQESSPAAIRAILERAAVVL